MRDDAVLENEWFLVAERKAIPLREGRRVVFGDKEVALFNLGDEFLAVDARCPHRAGPLADGIVSGKTVFCPLHTWKISLETGCALSGGAGQVRRYPVKIVADEIYINLKQGKFHGTAEACPQT